MAGHNKEKHCECDVYGKAWQHPIQLETHRWVHTGELPFDCSGCSMNFTCYEALLRHNRVHSGEMPFTYSTCGKTYTRIYSLLEHWHTHTVEHPFTYAKYGKGFTRSPKLLSHQQVHTGDRPFTRPFGCSDCCKDFKTGYDLKVHQRVHTPPVARNFQFVEAAGAPAVWKKN